MSSTKQLVVKRGKLVLKDGFSYNNSNGNIELVNNTDKVRLESIVNYLAKQTGNNYSIHYGAEQIYDTYNGEECIMLIPDHYNVAECGVNEDTNQDTIDVYDVYALNKDGKNVFDKNIVFFWSFDLDLDNNGLYVHREGIKNGLLRMRMLGKVEGYTDTDIDQIQSC